MKKTTTNIIKDAYLQGGNDAQGNGLWKISAEEKALKYATEAVVMQRSEQLIDFFKWLNTYEELGYTEKGINFYVEEYLKSINCA